jgi:hypothetical protein
MDEEEEEKEEEEEEDDTLTGCTPAHILCMQKQPKISVVRYFCVRDPKAFALCDQKGRCALHLVAQYSESVELLQYILQMDSKMAIKHFDESGTGEETTPLGLLCRRLEFPFPTFDKMVSSLIEVDSTVEVINNGMLDILWSFEGCLDQDILPGSRGEKSLILLGNLLNANPTVVKYQNSQVFHVACECLRGKLGVSVLSLFLSKDSTLVADVYEGSLPIHVAACHSCLDVLKFLHKARPELISALAEDGENSLHLALIGKSPDLAEANLKVQYLCEQCPALINVKSNLGISPLYLALDFDLGCAKYLCDIDESLVREKCAAQSGRLPLHVFILFLHAVYKGSRNSTLSEVSDKGDCFRLLLRLYPAAAGIKDDRLKTAYDTAVKKKISVYFIRLLLAADPALDPVKRRDLNFEARRQGMFLAFRALSSNADLIILAKLRFEDRDLLQHVISYL